MDDTDSEERAWSGLGSEQVVGVLGLQRLQSFILTARLVYTIGPHCRAQVFY